MDKNRQNIQIRFPSLLLIPVLSLLGIVLKVVGMTQYDWIHVIVSIPVALYFMWCAGYCVLALLGVMLIRILKGDDSE